jgi:hypothetical protein
MSLPFPSFLYYASTLLASLAMVTGCQRAEQIQSYRVPKERQVAPTDRMLVAIVPDGQQAWFFKVVGQVTAIDQQEKAIKDFFATIRPAADGSRPSWNLPASWSEEPGSMMRAATIVIPTVGKPLELAVTTLGWTGKPDDVLLNVNRWRGQMQLPPIGQDQLAESLHKLKAGDSSFSIVDLRGSFQGAGMTAPFAGGLPPGGIEGGGNPPPPGVENDLPAGHPPIGANALPPTDTTAANRDPIVPTFDTPGSWQAVIPPGPMRKAEFDIVDGSRAAKVTVTDFPAQAPKIADPLANVNRWRNEISLGPIESDALDANIESIDVDGQPAAFAAIVPDSTDSEQSQVKEATLGAIVPRGEQIWFIKLKGDRDLVVAEQENFKSFVKSLQFSDASGATHGN